MHVGKALGLAERAPSELHEIAVLLNLNARINCPLVRLGS